MGVKLTIYQDLVTRLNAKVPELLTVRKWNNQFTNEDRENAFRYPACFIGFTSMEWLPTSANTPLTTNLHQQQRGELIITLYLGFEKYEDESDSWPDIEPIIQKVWHWLQGWSGSSEYYNAFNRIQEREDNNHDNVIIWEIDFRVGVYDCAGEDTTLVDAAPVTLVVEGDLIIDVNTASNMRTDNELP